MSKAYEIILNKETGDISVNITDNPFNINAVFTGTRNENGVYGICVSSKEKIELGKLKVLEYALSREEELLKDQTELVRTIKTQLKDIWG